MKYPKPYSIYLKGGSSEFSKKRAPSDRMDMHGDYDEAIRILLGWHVKEVIMGWGLGPEQVEYGSGGF